MDTDRHMELKSSVRIVFLAFILILLTETCSASPYYGGTFSLPLVTKEPPSLHGYQFMLNYDPQKFQWRQFNIYFDGGFSHFWVTNTPYYTCLNIYSIAPVIRYTFKQRGPVFPYLDLSIGAAYLTKTHLDSRNLGIHYAFQDRIGIGILYGSSKQISLGLKAVHYSNAHLSDHNSGITVPIELDLGYRFN